MGFLWLSLVMWIVWFFNVVRFVRLEVNPQYPHLFLFLFEQDVIYEQPLQLQRFWWEEIFKRNWIIELHKMREVYEQTSLIPYILIIQFNLKKPLRILNNFTTNFLNWTRNISCIIQCTVNSPFEFILPLSPTGRKMANSILARGQWWNLIEFFDRQYQTDSQHQSI